MIQRGEIIAILAGIHEEITALRKEVEKLGDPPPCKAIDRMTERLSYIGGYLTGFGPTIAAIATREIQNAPEAD